MIHSRGVLRIQNGTGVQLVCVGAFLSLGLIVGCDPSMMLLPVPAVDDDADRELGDAPLSSTILPSPIGDCGKPANGCGPGLFPDFLFGLTNCPMGLACFTRACNAHDLCYGDCGRSQLGCDTSFLQEMRLACTMSLPPEDSRRDHCYSVAYVYYTLVSDYGDPFYDYTQEEACECVARKGIRLGRELVEDAFELEPEASCPFSDVDADLMCDDWEAAVGLDANYVYDAFEDSDGDGRVNLVEFVHQTDPFIPDTELLGANVVNP